MSKFSTTDFITQLNSNVLAKTYFYEVRIFGIQNNVPDATHEIMLNCNALNVPGINIGFIENKRTIIGISGKYPTSKSYTELNLTFYESESEKERKYFVEWMNKIFNKQTSRFGYYNDIVKNMQIIQFNKQGDKTYQCDILECFPSNLSPLDKAYAAGDSLPQFNVNMQFYDINETFYDNTLGINPFII